MKILVIDDEKPILATFRLFLTACGYDVLTAEDGQKGLALFHENRPDIVFTDINSTMAHQRLPVNACRLSLSD